MIATDLATEFNTTAQNSNRLGLPGQIGFSLKNLGYTDDYISTVKYKEVRWQDITLNKDLYIEEYKKLLFNRLTKSIDLE
jgi:hypothetical protein